MTTGGDEALHESNASGGFLPVATGAPPYSHWLFVYLHITVIITQLLQTQTSSIAVCAGCHNHYKSKQPPNDLCIHHKEWREFTPEGATVTCTCTTTVICSVSGYGVQTLIQLVLM